MTFYISDIYAVKPVEVTANEMFPTEYVTGDTITLSDLCEADIDLDYTVTFRGRTTRVADGGDYTFTANGTYEVEAVPSRPDYAASVKKTLYVTDEFTVTGQNVAKRHETDAPVTVSFSEFGAAFSAVGGIAPEIKEYSVSRYGTAVPDDGNGFTVSADGGYDVDVRAEYVKDGKTYDTYGRLYADVYTDETAYDVISVSRDSMFVSTNYINSTWDTMPTFSVGTRTVGGVTERMFDINKSSESLVALIRPLYSKAYYERLLADDPDLKVRFKYYVDPVNPGGENVLTFFRFGYDWATAAEYTWQTYTFDLSAFVDMYDGFLEGYDEVRDLVNGYESLTWASPSDWADNPKLWVYANVGKMRLDLTKMTVYGEADDCTAAVKPGQAVALCTDNDLADILDVRISDQPAGLVSSEVWHLGAWHTLADNVFRPSCAGTYRMRLTAARGAQLGVFETTVTVEGNVIETTRDDGLYILNDGGSFDLAETTAAPAGYTLTYEVRLALGNERTVTDIRPDGGVLHASDLPAYGCYEITALLVSPDSGPFNTMEYYTLLLDYAAADEPVWQGDVTETTLAYAQGWYWSGNALDTVSLVTDPTETLTGNYIRLYDEMREQAALQLLPLHSKAFYEQFRGQGYTFVFDAAVIRAHDWQVRIVRSYDATTGTTGDVYTSGTGGRLPLADFHGRGTRLQGDPVVFRVRASARIVVPQFAHRPVRGENADIRRAVPAEPHFHETLRGQIRRRRPDSRRALRHLLRRHAGILFGRAGGIGFGRYLCAARRVPFPHAGRKGARRRQCVAGVARVGDRAPGPCRRRQRQDGAFLAGAGAAALDRSAGRGQNVRG